MGSPDQCPFDHQLLGRKVVSCAVNVIVWMVPEVFWVWNEGGIMQQLLVQTKKSVVSVSTE